MNLRRSSAARESAESRRNLLEGGAKKKEVHHQFLGTVTRHGEVIPLHRLEVSLNKSAVFLVLQLYTV